MANILVGSFTATSTIQSVEAWLTNLRSRTTGGVKVHGHVASFQKAPQKIGYLNSVVSAADRADQARCTTISAAIRDLPASGGLILMTSDTRGAARAANQSSPWHCICVLRDGSTLWIYDPASDPDTMPPKQRIGEITGLAMVKALWTYCDARNISIDNVRIMGVAETGFFWISEELSRDGRW